MKKPEQPQPIPSAGNGTRLFKKQLECLLALCRYPAGADVSPDDYFKQLLSLLIPACRFPAQTVARIVYQQREVTSLAAYPVCSCTLQQVFQTDGKDAGFIEIGFTGVTRPEQPFRFTEGEKQWLKALAGWLEISLCGHLAKGALLKARLRLQQQEKLLEQKDLALKEVLERIALDKAEIKNQLLSGINTLILPGIGKIKKGNLAPAAVTRYLQVIEQNLQQLRSGLKEQPLASGHYQLSPREIEVCNMIKNGLLTKEIAEVLRISILTVERHRFNIRRKLGLSHNQVNLQTFLQNH